MVSLEAQKKIMKLKDTQKENQEYALNAPLEIQRKEWEEYASQAPLPSNINIETKMIGNISTDWISVDNKKDSVILYFHGGGLNQGSSITHHRLASYISKYSGSSILMHNYPLAPEHPFPEALIVSVEIYQWLIELGYTSKKIIFGADSSGAALAMATCLKLREMNKELPKAIFMLSPMLDFSLSGESMLTHKERDLRVFKEDLDLTVSYYCQNEDPTNYLISPIFGDIKDFPPTLIQVGSEEILLSDALRLKEQLIKHKRFVTLTIWEGMWHVFHSDVERIPEATKALKEVSTFIKEQLKRV
ncbi:MAG: alpha/beta hydrolase [Coprobacillaceae bacterium]